ncbi:hypothetical protein GCM10018771_20640 [Streptomyces cellulosae]|nr:hypothetical protein GCM10018771_20640 [Streptomyces cellulosae]
MVTIYCVEPPGGTLRPHADTRRNTASAGESGPARSAVAGRDVSETPTAPRTEAP